MTAPLVAAHLDRMGFAEARAAMESAPGVPAASPHLGLRASLRRKVLGGDIGGALAALHEFADRFAQKPASAEAPAPTGKPSGPSVKPSGAAAGRPLAKTTGRPFGMVVARSPEEQLTEARIVLACQGIVELLRGGGGVAEALGLARQELGAHCSDEVLLPLLLPYVAALAYADPTAAGCPCAPLFDLAKRAAVAERVNELMVRAAGLGDASLLEATLLDIKVSQQLLRDCRLPFS